MTGLPWIIAAATLCGIPLAFILGVIAGAKMYREVAPDDVDYSGGV